jgi:hypothetical protein
MKDYTVVRRVIEKLIDDYYTGSLTLVFENTFMSATNEEHITIVDEGDVYVEPMEIGGNISRNQGIVTLGIFTEIGQGTEKARQIASDLDVLFETAADDIAFGEREFKAVGMTAGSPFYQHNLLVPYQYFYGQES